MKPKQEISEVQEVGNQLEGVRTLNKKETKASNICQSAGSYNLEKFTYLLEDLKALCEYYCFIQLGIHYELMVLFRTYCY